jgi:hypothetical protein
MAVPVKFEHSNRFLGPPQAAEYSENIAGVVGMHTWTDGEQSLSRWKLTWRERLQVLLHGHVWITVLSGWTQPPVAIETRREYLKVRDEPQPAYERKAKP